MTRLLIVTADDFGLSAGVNEGVARAHREGIVTATSLMVRQPFAQEAASMASALPGLDVGLHVDLGEWEYTDGEWIARYERVDGDDPVAVAAEVESQLALFERLVGRLPTHLDSHQHVHGREPCRAVVRAVADRLGVAVRHEPNSPRYLGEFYGQSTEGDPLPHLVTVDRLVDLVASLDEGTTELCCHPATRADMPGAYRDERVAELAVLCDPAVRVALGRAGVQLTGFVGRSA